MPDKNKKSKARYRVANWNEYNQALKNRGSLTFLFDPDFDQYWDPITDGKIRHGRPLKYSEYAINLILSLRVLFKLPLRQTIGFIESLLLLMEKDLAVPDFSRLSRRSEDILKNLKLAPLEKNSYIVIDSTGLKVFGEKEWLETKHGKQYQRKIWRKVHIGADKDGKIISRVLSDHKTDDRMPVPNLLDQIDINNVTDLISDGGYDSHQIYDDLEKQSINPIIPPPRHAVIKNPDNPR